MLVYSNSVFTILLKSYICIRDSQFHSFDNQLVRKINPRVFDECKANILYIGSDSLSQLAISIKSQNRTSSSNHMGIQSFFNNGCSCCSCVHLFNVLVFVKHLVDICCESIRVIVWVHAHALGFWFRHEEKQPVPSQTTFGSVPTSRRQLSP